MGAVGLSELLAVVLLLSGALVIGAIIGLMAVVRTVMLFRWHKNREMLRRQYTRDEPRG